MKSRRLMKSPPRAKQPTSRSWTASSILHLGAYFCYHRAATPRGRGGIKMRKLLLAFIVVLICPMTAVSGPKEDAFQVVEQFKKAFDTSDVEGVVRLFAPDAVLLGTQSPILATKTEQIESYFQGLRQFMPRSVIFEDYSTLVVSETAVLFAGLDTFTQTNDGKTVTRPVRFTMLIVKTDQGWRIRHFHSSARPSS
jgi:uncharacterized protein (TIGR02246 family)